jgi:DNA-binding MarR family transcriptional regulator
MLAPLVRALIAAELPILEAHGLSMWGYSVLVALDRSAIRTQAALAEAIGADKTRIIAILDELQDKGLIERVADPEDRRARLLEITEKGRRLKEAAQAEIQRGEENWLGTLSAGDRATFLRVLQGLSGRACRDLAALFLHQGCESAGLTTVVQKTALSAVKWTRRSRDGRSAPDGGPACAGSAAPRPRGRPVCRCGSPQPVVLRR